MSGLDNKGSWINKNQQILSDKLDKIIKHLENKKSPTLTVAKLRV
nr:MAG TPA: protein of unknown function (DUF4083) [Caudoviricetes sp.]